MPNYNGTFKLTHSLGLPEDEGKPVFPPADLSPNSSI